MTNSCKEQDLPDWQQELHHTWNDSLSSASIGTQRQLHPAIGTAIGGFVILNVGLLLSLPPVLMGRGAPYLPTLTKKMDLMFAQLKTHFSNNRGARTNPTGVSQITSSREQITWNEKLIFVDLGSGDGRVVFRAAREGLFHKSIGYEINPFLYCVAQARRLAQSPMYYTKTQFYLSNLWDVNLTQANVVAVYGLHPIMKDLGVKLHNELQPGSIVLSNVFAIPGWKPSSISHGGLYVYIVPECWEQDTLNQK